MKRLLHRRPSLSRALPGRQSHRTYHPLLSLDMLGAEAPKFNIGGKDSVRTYTGGLVSLLILSATFLFAMLKWQKMLLRNNPEIVSFTDDIAISSDDYYDLSLE